MGLLTRVSLGYCSVRVGYRVAHVCFTGLLLREGLDITGLISGVH